MATRDEIEAAVERFEGSGGFACSFIEECEDDLFILSQAYITERAERQRRIEAAAEKIEQSTMQILLRNGVDMRKHRLVIVKEVTEIITRCLDGETA